MEKDSQRITKIKLFINNYNWERINFPLEKDHLKKFEKNSVTVTPNVFQIVKNKLFF